MNTEFPNITAEATIGELYNPAIDIATSKKPDREKAEKYFLALVDHVLEMSKTERPDDNVDIREATRIVHSNLGYWAGYFEKGTIEKVHELYGSSHPIFGNSSPTTSEAFKLGLELGKSMKK